MKREPRKKKIYTKLSNRNIFLLTVQLVFTLFAIFFGVIVRDYLLTEVVISNSEKAKTLVLEGENMNVEPNSYAKYFLNANPQQTNSRVATIRMNFTNANIVDFQPESGYVAVGTCENGERYRDNKLCVDLGNTAGDIKEDEKLGEVTLMFGNLTNFSVATASGNGFYNGQSLDRNENTALNYDGFSTLPLTGEETETQFDLTNYPAFLIISGVIIISGLAGLIYLVIKKDGKNNRSQMGKIATVSGIVILASSTIIISSYLQNTENQIKTAEAGQNCTPSGNLVKTGLNCCDGNFVWPVKFPNNTSFNMCLKLNDGTPCEYASHCKSNVCDTQTNSGYKVCTCMKNGKPCTNPPVIPPTKKKNFGDICVKGEECKSSLCVVQKCKCLPNETKLPSDFPNDASLCCNKYINSAGKCGLPPTQQSECDRIKGDTAKWGGPGAYCSTDNPGNLLYCQNTNNPESASGIKCPNGCQTSPQGTSDKCKVVTPPTNPPANPTNPQIKPPTTPPINPNVPTNSNNECGTFQSNSSIWKGTGTYCSRITTGLLLYCTNDPEVGSGMQCPNGCVISTTGPNDKCVTAPVTTIPPTNVSTQPATGTPTMSISPGGVVCKAMDIDSNLMLNYVDLYAFIQVYNKKCSNYSEPPIQMSCGPQDVNVDMFINYIDLAGLIDNYYPKKLDCRISPD